MYTVQYWNPRDAQWRGTGTPGLPDITVARTRMHALSEQCHGACRFRVTKLIPD